jgi:uncharacterized membrane protein
MSGAVDAIALATALGCGLSAGALFAFSAFVMNGLQRLPPAQGIAAMQSINITAITPAFMTALFGTAALCLGLSIWAVTSWDDDRAPWTLAAGALYLIGVIGVTMTANVPRNNRLAALAPDGAGAGEQWRHYVRTWTAWNHVRTLAGVAASALLIVAVGE